jgi:hypothetical protein
VDNYSSITTGDPGQISTTSAALNLYKKILASIGAFNPFRNAYAASDCSVLSTSRTLFVTTPGGKTSVFSPTKNATTEYTLQVVGTQECITSIQDSGNYIAFLSDNIYGDYGKCDIFYLRKKDAFVYCLKTDLSALISGFSSSTQVTYSIGIDSTFRGTGDYQNDYASNSSGYASPVTKNGNYLFARFTTTVNNKNYVGIMRFTLNASSAPTQKVVLLKEQIISGGGNQNYSYWLRGLIALENGDLIVDYIDNNEYYANNAVLSRPANAAYRKYIAVNGALIDPSLQPSFMLWQGAPDIDNGSSHTVAWLQGGALSSSLKSVVPMSYNGIAQFSDRSKIISITSNPNSTDRIFYVCTQVADFNRATTGTAYDLFKITVTSDGTTASIGAMTYLGQTNSSYPIAYINSKIYSFYKNNTGGVSITSHPTSGDSNSVDTVIHSHVATETSYTLYSSPDSIFVLDGFNGYVGGNLVGANKIHQLKVLAGTETVTNINLGDVTSGLFTRKTFTVNPATSQIQISGTKKASANDASDSMQWSAFLDQSGVSNLKTYSSLNVLNYDSPILSLRYSDGTKPTFSN